MVSNQIFTIFRKRSKTFFYTSLFFPAEIRDDVFILYSFVRKADDLVDSCPARKKSFYAMLDEYKKATAGYRVTDKIVQTFVAMATRKKIPLGLVNSFWKSMEKDLYNKKYNNFKTLEDYMYGSSEVIGLMMTTILNLPKESHSQARLLGKSMQYLNFIRDIKEDLELKRLYFPKSEMDKYGLKSLDFDYTKKNKLQFELFLRAQIKRFLHWQNEAERGFSYFPKRLLIPVVTASQMYKWTAHTIYDDPFIVYDKEIKPSFGRIILSICYNTFLN